MSHYGGYVGDTGGSQIDGSALSAHARTPSASALLNRTSLKTTPCVHGLAHQIVEVHFAPAPVQIHQGLLENIGLWQQADLG